MLIKKVRTNTIRIGDLPRENCCDPEEKQAARKMSEQPGKIQDKNTIVLEMTEVPSMKQMIMDEISKARTSVQNVLNEEISDDRAFNYVTLMYYYMPRDKRDYHEMKGMITDGPNDGGIDYIVYDEETPKVIIAQSKMTSSLEPNVLISELNKMSNTVSCFINGNTGAYNAAVKRELQNALDRLPDEDAGNVEYVIFTTAKVDEDNLYRKIENGSYAYSKDMVTVYQEADIEGKILNDWEEIEKVSEATVNIDMPHNMLRYETDDIEGIMVNVSSNSMRALYNKYVDKGLFDLNIRKYIKSKLVDSGINRTLNEERENFWFLNNGIIIACDDFAVDGNKIKLYGFSIVNGGQTTSLIGKYNGRNTQEFYIPCKIIAKKQNDDSTGAFFSKIAEATNSQKPIYARDLKSNSPEMKRLQKWLADENVFLEIKRGDTRGRQRKRYRIKNDELGQLIFSFVNQKPGTSRSGKKAIFENNTFYNQIYKQNYEKDLRKKQFILDLIDLNDRYGILEEKLKTGNVLQPSEKDVLKNGKQIIFAILGVLYMIQNGDIATSDLVQDTSLLKAVQFTYGSFISNYTADDLDGLLENLVVNIIQIVQEQYEIAAGRGECTSISNFFKTDKKYYEDIMNGFIKAYTRQSIGRDIKECSKILNR